MVSVWVAGATPELRAETSIDCAQIVEPSTRSVASIRADVWTILDLIGILLLWRQASAPGTEYGLRCECRKSYHVVPAGCQRKKELGKKTGEKRGGELSNSR